MVIATFTTFTAGMAHAWRWALAAFVLVLATAAPATAQTPVAAPSPPAATASEKVIIGVYVNDIQELSFPTYSYAVDLYVWFRWADRARNPAKSMEFMNRVAPNDHQRDMLLDEPKPMEDGTAYQVLREQGRFATKFQLARFPFDEQVLKVEIEDSVAGSVEQIYVADTVPVTLNPKITLPGFLVGQPVLRILDNHYPTNFGDLSVSEAESYSRVSVEIPISRALVSVSVKAFLPILLIVICASLIFFIMPSRVDGRIGLGITALLTLVALQLTATSSLPDVGYLMLIDKVYLASYAFIISALGRVVATSWTGEGGRDVNSVARADRRWALVLLLLYAATIGLSAAWTFNLVTV